LEQELNEKKIYLVKIYQIIGSSERGRNTTGIDSQKTLISKEEKNIEGFKDFLT